MDVPVCVYPWRFIFITVGVYILLCDLILFFSYFSTMSWSFFYVSICRSASFYDREGKLVL